MAVFWSKASRGFRLMENLDFINCFEFNDSEKDDLLVGLQSNDQKKLNSKYLYDNG